MSLTQKTAALARAAPFEWGEFLAAFNEHTLSLKDGLVKAPAEQMSEAQGRAREGVSLAEIFRDAVKDAERIADRIKRRNT